MAYGNRKGFLYGGVSVARRKLKIPGTNSRLPRLGSRLAAYFLAQTTLHLAGGAQLATQVDRRKKEEIHESETNT